MACFRFGPTGLSLADPPWRDGPDLAGGLERANARLVSEMPANGNRGAGGAASPD